MSKYHLFWQIRGHKINQVSDLTIKREKDGTFTMNCAFSTLSKMSRSQVEEELKEILDNMETSQEEFDEQNSKEENVS